MLSQTDIKNFLLKSLMGVLIYFALTPFIFYFQYVKFLEPTPERWILQPIEVLFVDYNPIYWAVFIASLLVGWLCFEVKDKK